MAGDEGRNNRDARKSVERRIVVRRRGCFGIGMDWCSWIYVCKYDYIILGILINILCIWVLS